MRGGQYFLYLNIHEHDPTLIIICKGTCAHCQEMKVKELENILSIYNEELHIHIYT